MTPLAPLITNFLRDDMPRQRGYSRQTCETYAISFKLLLEYAATRTANTAIPALDRTTRCAAHRRLSEAHRAGAGK